MLLRPKILCLFCLRLSKLSTPSCRSLSPSGEVVVEEVAGAEDVVVVAAMVAEEEAGDGECFCV